MITFTVNLDTNNTQGMEVNILKEFLSQLTNAINGAIVGISGRVKSVVSEALKDSLTWNELLKGQLSTFLCLDNPSNALNQIENAIISEINIRKATPIASQLNINGSLTVELLDDSYRQILGLGDTSYVTLNGKLIPWLEWLLFSGTSPVLFKGKLLRTNRGVYVVSDKDNFSIPPEHAGVQSDNFITRALKPLESKIGSIIEQEISGRL